MSDISMQELQIVLNLAAHMAHIDRDVAVFEFELIERIAEVVGLDEGGRSAINGKLDSLEASLGGLQSPRAKEFAVKTLCAVAYSDGQQHPAEVAFVQTVNDQLGGALVLAPWEQWEDYILEVVEELNRIGSE